MLDDRRKTYMYTGRVDSTSFIQEMRKYSDMYNIAMFKIATAVETEFLRKKKLLLII